MLIYLPFTFLINVCIALRMDKPVSESINVCVLVETDLILNIFSSAEYYGAISYRISKQKMSPRP